MKAAVYTGARNLYEAMVLAATSLLENSDVDKIYLLTEDDEFPHKLPKKVENINVSGQTYFTEGGANWNSQFTYMAMMRAALAKVFPDLDRILSLDVDTLVVDDVSDIWDIDLTDYYFAASREPHRCHDGFLYTNIGVALYNLEKLRRDGKADEVIDLLNWKKYMFLEQDCFCETCQGHIYDLPGEYNATRFTVFEEPKKIIHFAGIRDWQKMAKKEYLRLKKSEKTKKDYMIHCAPVRRWYVDGYLIPSMTEQGIDEDRITVWEDTDGVGNLESFVRSMQWVYETQHYMDGIWHMQDDIVISKRFAELTQADHDGIVCGFCNEKWDGGNVNLIGVVPAHFTWFSFTCMRIPNLYSGEFVEWFDEHVRQNNEFPELTDEGKNDDAVWKKFIEAKHPSATALNMIPNIVDHVDYLIGGSIVNKQRDGIRKAYRFEDTAVVAELEEKLRRCGVNGKHTGL